MQTKDFQTRLTLALNVFSPVRLELWLCRVVLAPRVSAVRVVLVPVYSSKQLQVFTILVYVIKDNHITMYVEDVK